MHQPNWIQLLPLAIIALIMWRRWKGMAVARPLKVGRMWIVPVVYGLLVGAMLVLMPPATAGWGMFALGMVIGGAIGWQRARLLKLHIDEGTGALMMRQSPAGLAVIVGVIVLRRLFLPSQAGGAPAGVHPALPLATDALLGFALGMIVGYRIELWRRAKALHTA